MCSHIDRYFLKQCFYLNYEELKPVTPSVNTAKQDGFYLNYEELKLYKTARKAEATLRFLSYP